jgi:hypothetical protein
LPEEKIQKRVALSMAEGGRLLDMATVDELVAVVNGLDTGARIGDTHRESAVPVVNQMANAAQFTGHAGHIAGDLPGCGTECRGFCALPWAAPLEPSRPGPRQSR